jgi:PAS domain S-box-containing protein
MEMQNLYWLQAVLAAALALFLSVYLWRHRAITAARFLIAIMLETGFWSLAYAFELMSLSLDARLFWVKAQYLGAVWLGPTFLAFSLCIAGVDKWVTWRRLWFLAVIPLLTILAAWTNSWHGLVWSTAFIDPSSPGLSTVYSRGIIFWAYLTYAYLLLLLGTLVLLRAVWKARRVYRYRLSILLLGVGLPWLFNALYVMGIKPFSYVDLTPLAFALVGLLFTLGIFRARLMHLIPLAREALMENLPDPVLVLDAQDRLVDLNSAAQDIFGPEASKYINKPLDTIFISQPALNEVLGADSEGRITLELELNGWPRIFEIRVSALKDLRNISVGRYLIFRDITQSHKIQGELRESEERYRTTFEHTGTAMMIAGKDTIMRMVNSKYAEIAGFSADEIEGKKSWQEFVHPDDLERMLSYHKKRREDEEAPREYEFRFIDRWGNQRWMDNTVNMVPGTDLAVASLLDISDRKLADQRESARLRRLQRQRATLVELSTHPDMAAGNMEQTAYLVNEVVADTMEVERVALWLLSKDGAALTSLDSYIRSRKEHLHSPDQPLPKFPRYMRALQNERFIAAYDAQQDPLTNEFNEILLKPNNIVSSLDAAIRLSGQVRGVLCINQVGGHRRWHSDEISFAVEIADQVAQALLNRERRKAQEALKESHERYSTFLEKLPDPVVVYDMEGCAQYMNSAFEETFGWKRGELLGKRIDFVPPESAGGTQKAIEEMKRGGQISYFPTKRLTRDGRILDVILGYSPYYDQIGEQIGNIVILRDVTALAQAQARLKESEERYRSLVENTPYGLLLAEMASGRILYANSQLAKIFGYDDLVGDCISMWDVIDPEEHESAQKRLMQHLEGNVPAQGHVYTGFRKDGARIRFKITAALVQSMGKQVMQAIISDVTNEEMMERQLHQAQKMEAVGTLAGGVAHEFNNLLMAIRGYSQLLIARGNLEPLVREPLEKISQTTRRAADLANTMLSFSRPETGHKEPVDLNQALLNLQGLLQGTLPPNIEQKMELASDLPLLMANPNQLEQVFLNLAVNARDAMPDGGKLTFSTKWLQADDSFKASRGWASQDVYVQVVVEDTGQGMGQTVQARIFEPFFSTKEPGKGTGLGLFVAYSIITKHGGGIEVESKPGMGTRFAIYLPADAGLEMETLQPKTLDELPMGAGQRILVVDDEASLREITREALENFGYEISEAANGAEAMEVYEKEMRQGGRFDLVLLDLAMPIMDGAACFNKLVSLDPSALVIITTGHAHDQAGLEKLGGTPFAVIKKPFDLANLLKKVHRAVHHFQ